MPVSVQEVIAQADLSPTIENRIHARHLCLESKVVRFALRPEFRGRRALLLDVSTGGIGFLLQEPLEVGTVLTVEMPRPGNDALGRMARVRHCCARAVPYDAPWLPNTPAMLQLLRWLFDLHTLTPEGKGWHVGCEFDRSLSAEELQALLAALRTAPSV
jgi:hypothetical protein